MQCLRKGLEWPKVKQAGPGGNFENLLSDGKIHDDLHKTACGSLGIVMSSAVNKAAITICELVC